MISSYKDIIYIQIQLRDTFSTLSTNITHVMFREYQQLLVVKINEIYIKKILVSFLLHVLVQIYYIITYISRKYFSNLD